jgi:hypothetical protein
VLTVIALLLLGGGGVMYAFAMSLPFREKRWQFGIGSLLKLTFIAAITACAASIHFSLAIVAGYFLAGFYCLSIACMNIQSRHYRRCLVLPYVFAPGVAMLAIAVLDWLLIR